MHFTEKLIATINIVDKSDVNMDQKLIEKDISWYTIFPKRLVTNIIIGQLWQF